jgi:hypothetical protein
MPDLTPLEDLAVNNRFWLGEGRKIVQSRVTRLEDAAGKLVAAVGWFWTVYTAAALVGVALADRNLDTWALVVIALPAVALIAAYGLGTWVLMPVYTKFIVNVPDEVEAELTKAYEEKRKRLGIAFFATAIAAVLLVIAIAVTAEATPTANQSFSADIAAVDGTNTVAVGGQFLANQAVTVTVEPGEKPSTDAKSSVRRAVASGSGQLDLAIPLVGSAASWKVTASWTEKDAAKTETLTIEASSSPTPSQT